MSLLSKALTYSSVSVLDLSNCNINDNALLSLSENLCEPLIFLHLEFTNAGLSKFFGLLSRSRLKMHAWNQSYRSTPTHEKIITNINNSRAKSHAHKLEVAPFLDADFQSQTLNEYLTTTMSMESAPELSERKLHRF